jgi:isoleucyl-tRNA synthetase
MSSPKHHHSFIDGEFSLPGTEEKVLEFWKTNQIFEKSLQMRQITSDKRQGKEKLASETLKLKPKTFVFYEGPPTANGKPGLHHILARAFKDIIPRFKTMQGYLVPRKGGWDTHGLPVEIEVEKQLGLKSKKEIEQYGIAAFNAMCRESVWKYKEMWEKLTDRMGFWIDMKDPYITYETDYIESLWWIISQIANQKLLYKGYKILPWCTRCGTGLSSHELGQPGAYATVEDESVYVKFKLKPGQKIGNFETNNNTYVLSWTTTPWTLPGNVALAVGKGIKYVGVRMIRDYVISKGEDYPKTKRGEVLILAKERLSILDGPYTQDWNAIGKDLVGLEYEPLFDIKALQNEKSHKIYPADFVTTTDGTGVVHTAVMYGEDDYALGIKVGLPQHHTVDETGAFTKDLEKYGLAGMIVKSKDKAVEDETTKKIITYLDKTKLLLKAEKYSHEYPHCWRCGTPLLYYARSAWFVAMSKLRTQLLENNSKIHWVPEHIKNGRFGEWLKEVKDWNFSRERYWGTPLPVWECKECGHTQVIGSLTELEQKTAPAKNIYYLMRHAFPETVMLGVIDSGQGRYHLTPSGRNSAKEAAEMLKKDKIDLIISSDIIRAKETARIVAKVLGVTVQFEPRIREINLGVLSGQPDSAYHRLFPTYEERFEKRPEGGESVRDVGKRVWEFFRDIEKKYKGKNILIISHEYSIWAMSTVMHGWSEKQAVAEMKKKKRDFIDVAEVRKVPFRIVPRDAEGSVDLHRPFIDEITFKCPECKKGVMRRVKEICDVWYDSGSMPFAQWHYPFENREKVDGYFSAPGRGKMRSTEPAEAFPADYISEAIDQTRGWFYTLLAVSTLLGKGEPYKNVICLGLLNDKNGRKMSKSVGNVIDPWELMNKHGIDAVRWYLYTMNPPGDPKNFDEQELAKTFRRVHLIFYNCALFWRTYADKKVAGSKPKVANKNPLDQWILMRLDETITNATKSLEKYEVRESAIEIERFIDDLSRWYIRRSRRRLQKPESKSDYTAASATLGYALLQTVKLMAPFNPFFAEGMYRMLGGDMLSVHLDSWPTVSSKQSVVSSRGLILQMETVRKIASDVLAKRAEGSVKVRQPLSRLSIKYRAPGIKLAKKLLEILKDEINVKKVVYDAKLKEPFVLDTKITPELRDEGVVREFIRIVAELRAKANFKPSDKITLFAELAEALKTVILKNEKNIMKETNSKSVAYKRTGKFTAEIETKLGDTQVWLAVKKV